MIGGSKICKFYCFLGTVIGMVLLCGCNKTEDKYKEEIILEEETRNEKQILSDYAERYDHFYKIKDCLNEIGEVNKSLVNENALSFNQDAYDELIIKCDDFINVPIPNTVPDYAEDIKIGMIAYKTKIISLKTILDIQESLSFSEMTKYIQKPKELITKYAMLLDATNTNNSYNEDFRRLGIGLKKMKAVMDRDSKVVVAYTEKMNQNDS